MTQITSAVPSQAPLPTRESAVPERRPAQPTLAPRSHDAREYGAEARDRADQLAAPPSTQPGARESERPRDPNWEQGRRDGEEAARQKIMREIWDAQSKAFMEQWKIQHGATAEVGAGLVQGMRATSEAMSRVMQKWSQAFWGAQ